MTATRTLARLLTIGLLAAVAATASAGGESFVNWESPPVHPVDLTPSGERLLVVNTANDRLLVYAVDAGGLVLAGAVPVGLEPVSVRARNDDEAWVVNHLSDSVSVVDLDTLRVVRTIHTGDEPADVVFAGAPRRAFISISQENALLVVDPADPGVPPIDLPIAGEDPRALATDGTHVWAAIFEAGNGTTIIGAGDVSSELSPYAGSPNPPPNAGDGFDPPIAIELPEAPHVSVIVKKDAGGAWRDGNGADWSAAVGWDLHGHDVAVIDAATLAISYVTGLMNTNMALSVDASGRLLVVGLEHTNEIAFEPNLRGTFVRVVGAVVDAGATTPSALVDLNPHLDYATGTIPQPQRDLSLGDPRGVAQSTRFARTYVTGMGSNDLLVLDAGLSRVGRVDLGSGRAGAGTGPTGLAVDDARSRVYVLNRFDASISIIDQRRLAEVDRVPFFDPTPEVIRAGRPFLYDTHRTSGLGQASCASCHIDGRGDQIAWDLGDPQGEMKRFNQDCNFGFGGCGDWHPMKGPMTTQTMVGLAGTAPFHWRGDREDLAAFNGAFESLMGDDVQLTDPEMDAFVAYIETLVMGPNPNRLMNGQLPALVPGVGDPFAGRNTFDFATIDAGTHTCLDCHLRPAGTNGLLTSATILQSNQSIVNVQLRNMYEKTGFDHESLENNRGFGYHHDGELDSILDYLRGTRFNFEQGEPGEADRADVLAYLLCFPTGTHAGVGAQATIGTGDAGETARRDAMLAAAAGSSDLDVIVKGRFKGEARGFVLLGGTTLQSDRASEVVSVAALDAAAGLGNELTWTLVPAGSGQRRGVDQDEDGFFDHDEIDVCARPDDPASTPRTDSCTCEGDATGDGAVDVSDVLAVLKAWGPCPKTCPADLDGDGAVAVGDLLIVLGAWGDCPK